MSLYGSLFDRISSDFRFCFRIPYCFPDRYIGTMVADIHRTLLYGGVFLYPTDREHPKGKLRLLYEAFPMAFLIENAGGVATTGREPILDIVPSDVHQRVPVYMGSREDIADILNIFEQYGDCASPLESDLRRITREDTQDSFLDG